MSHKLDYLLDVLLNWYTTSPYEFKGGQNIARKGVLPGKAYIDIIKFYNQELQTSDEFRWYLNELHDKLFEDGYLSRFTLEKDYGQFRYTPTVKAFYFAKEGGYNGKYKKEQRIKFSQSIKDWMIILGAWSAGIGLLWSLIKRTFYTFLITEKAGVVILIVFILPIGWLLSELIKKVLYSKN